MRKYFVVMLAMMMMTGCTTPSTPPAQEASTAPIETPETDKVEDDAMQEGNVSDTYTLNYPSNMQEKGFTELVVLEQRPTRVVSLTNSPVLALHELSVPMVGIPKTSVVEWPEKLQAEATALEVVKNPDFDIESVIALDTDLVVMGYTKKDTYGKVLQNANIPVYYVDDGHTVTYESIKLLTQELITTFGEGSPEGQAILDRFEILEKRLEDIKEQNNETRVMVLQSAPPSHYIQTEGGTLGSMLAMMGYQNVYVEGKSSMVPLDFEQALTYESDIVFAVGSAKTSEAFQEVMEADYKNNEAFWYSIQAIKEDNVIYLPVNFISSAGISVIDNINNLIDLIEEHNAN